MAINYPASLDALTNPTAWQPRNTPWIEETTVISNLNDAVKALETKVGITGSSDVASLDYKIWSINPLTTKGDIFVRSTTANSRLPVGSDGQMLVADSTQAIGVKYINPTSGGTVTTVSIVPANGLTGSVLNPTTTSAITLGTTLTGIVKGNGTALVVATAGTDYYAPAGLDVAVVDGGTGVSTLTAYAPIFGGTTWTGALQSGTVGSTGQIMTSNGASSIPTFQNLSIPSYARTPVAISALSNLGTTTSTTIYIDREITLYYITANVYWTVSYTNVDIDYSLDGTTGWTTLFTEGAQKTFTGTTEVTNGIININKVYLRVKATTGTGWQSAYITLKG